VEVGPEPALYHREARVTRVSYPTPAPANARATRPPVRRTARSEARRRIRYAHTAAAATWIPDGGRRDGSVRRAPGASRPGQSLVLYDGDRVVAGGVIAAVEGS